jgi:hypothetical protein
MNEMMKQSIIIITGLVVLLFSCEREISPEQADKFIKFYGNYLMDEAKDIEVLDDGGYAICGIDSLPDLGKRMVLVVTDEYGNVKEGFPKYYTEEGLESGANSIVPVRGGQGGYLLCGFVERPVLGTFEANDTKTQKDIFIVKASNSGQENWQKSYGSSVDDEVILHAVERISSGYMLAGYKVKDNKSDIMIMGIYEEGDSIPLGLNYNNPYAENGKATFLLQTEDRYLCVCTYDKIGEDGTDILVLNFDWEMSALGENLTDDSDESGMCIAEEDLDHYLVLGNRINVSGKTEMVIHLVETEGLLIRSSTLVTTIAESNMDLIANRIVKTADGRYAIVGTRQSNGTREIFLQFLASDYAVEGRIIFGGTGSQTGADIDLADDGGLVLLGTNSDGQGSMISLIKTSDTGDL